MYKLITDSNGQVRTDCVINIDLNAYIPFDENNKHYQQYLKWLAEGNTPEPADE